MIARSTLVLLITLTGISSLQAQNKFHRKALSAYHRGDYTSARDHLNKIAQHDDASKVLLAKILYQLSDYTPIESILSGMDNLDSDARLALATSYHMAGQFEEARTWWKTLLTDENAAVINSNIGDTFYGTGDIDSSLFYINKAIALDPYSDLYILNAGIAYGAMEESGKACANFFLSALRGNTDAIQLYESENCISWQSSWLDALPGNHIAQVANPGLSGVHQPVISTNEVFLLREHGREQHVILKDIVRTDVGLVFAFQGADQRLMHRWLGFDSKPSFVLKDISNTTAGR